MKFDDFQTWMEGYLNAWASHDPADIGRLFAEDGQYFTAPYREPWAGRAGIVSGWLGRKDNPGEYSFNYKLLGVDNNTGFVRGWTMYHNPPRAYSNLWVITLNEVGECLSFIEWWMLED